MGWGERLQVRQHPAGGIVVEVAAADHLAKVEAERDHFRAALESIDDALDCAGHVDAAAAQDVQGETPISFDGQCFEAWPNDPEEWCAGCIAHVALSGAR